MIVGMASPLHPSPFATPRVPQSLKGTPSCEVTGSLASGNVPRLPRQIQWIPKDLEWLELPSPLLSWNQQVTPFISWPKTSKDSKLLPFGDPAVAHSVFIAKSAAFCCLKRGENLSSGFKVYAVWGYISMTMYKSMQFMSFQCSMVDFEIWLILSVERTSLFLSRKWFSQKTRYNQPHRYKVSPLSS